MKNSEQNKENFKEVNVKKIVMLVALVLISFTAASAEENKTQFEFRARPEFRVDFNEENEVTRADFNVVRGYVGMTQQIADNMRGRLFIDVDASRTILPEDGGTRGGTRTRIRYADFNWQFFPFLEWSFGVIPKRSAWLPNSPSNLCQADAAEHFIQAESSDFGTGISGEQGMFSYGLQILNGEGSAGFRDAVNTIPLVIGNISVQPMEMIGVDASFGYTQNAVENEASPTGVDAVGSIVDLAAQLSFEHDLFELPIQVAYSMNAENDEAESVNSMALYFEPMVKLEDLIGAPLSVVCGIAILDEETGVETDEETRIIPGLVFRPHRAVTMLLSYEMVNEAATEGIESSNLRFRIDYRMRTSTE